jgi:hypothetical protein
MHSTHAASALRVVDADMRSQFQTCWRAPAEGRRNDDEGPGEPGGHAMLVGLLEKRAEMLALVSTKAPEDRYAALHSRYRTTAARDLVRQVFGQIAHWRSASGGKRVRQFRAKRGQAYHEAIERFVGDLLRAQGDSNASNGGPSVPSGRSTAAASRKLVITRVSRRPGRRMWLCLLPGTRSVTYLVWPLLCLAAGQVILV